MSKELLEEIFKNNIDLNINYRNQELKRDILIAMEEFSKAQNKKLLESIESALRILPIWGAEQIGKSEQYYSETVALKNMEFTFKKIIDENTRQI